MRFGFTRDSVIFWLAILGAVITYLMSAGAPPGQWTYQDWLQAASFVVATLAGKLATSPLPHSEEGGAKITPSGR